MINLKFILFIALLGLVMIGGCFQQRMVANPIFVPNPGEGPFDAPVQVKILSSTAGADIYYTIDGSWPDDLSILYEGPFTIDTSTTIKARAYKDPMFPSNTMSADYEIYVPVNLFPHFEIISPENGTEYIEFETVHIVVDAYDEDGTIVQVGFRGDFFNAEKNQSFNGTWTYLENPPYEFDIVLALPGTYTFHLEAFDDGGAGVLKTITVLAFSEAGNEFCVDTDSGINKFVYGTASYKYQGSDYSAEDSCIIIVPCESGTSGCYHGSLVTPVLSCEPPNCYVGEIYCASDYNFGSANILVNEFDETCSLCANGVCVAGGGSSGQIISLNNGWNYMSLTRVPSSLAVEDVMSVLVENGLLDIVQTPDGDTYDPNNGINTIGNMKLTQGYQIRVSEDTELYILGPYVELPITIPLKSDWNLIPYPSQQYKSGMAVLQPLIDAGVFVKAQDEAGNSIEYLEGIGWIDNIDLFEPGEGYMVNVNADFTLTID